MRLYRSRDAALDTNALAEGMGARGWFMGRSLEPEDIHFAINPVHAPVIDRYLADLRAVSLEVRESGRVGALAKSTYCGPPLPWPRCPPAAPAAVPSGQPGRGQVGREAGGEKGGGSGR